MGIGLRSSCESVFVHSGIFENVYNTSTAWGFFFYCNICACNVVVIFTSVITTYSFIYNGWQSGLSIWQAAKILCVVCWADTWRCCWSIYRITQIEWSPCWTRMNCMEKCWLSLRRSGRTGPSQAGRWVCCKCDKGRFYSVIRQELDPGWKYLPQMNFCTLKHTRGKRGPKQQRLNNKWNHVALIKLIAAWQHECKYQTDCTPWIHSSYTFSQR